MLFSVHHLVSWVDGAVMSIGRSSSSTYAVQSAFTALATLLVACASEGHIPILHIPIGSDGHFYFLPYGLQLLLGAAVGLVCILGDVFTI